MRITKKISNITVALVLIALVSSLAFGQGGAPSGAAGSIHKRRSHQRQSASEQERSESKTTAAEEATLPNGLRVVLLRSTKVPTFNMQMVVLSGGLSDKADYRGLASFTASLLREGTAKRSSKDIAEQIDALGATLAANSGLSSMTSTVRRRGSGREFRSNARTLCRCRSQSELPAGGSRQIQDAHVGAVAVSAIDPAVSRGRSSSNARSTADHPASLSQRPADSIQKLTTKDLAEFHSTYYRPNNAILAIVGDVTMKEHHAED